MTDLQQAYAWAENEAMRRPPADVQHLRVLAGAVKDLEEVSAKYNELIMEVGTKVPGETRHETAKRYIYEKEHPLRVKAEKESRYSLNDIRQMMEDNAPISDGAKKDL